MFLGGLLARFGRLLLLDVRELPAFLAHPLNLPRQQGDATREVPFLLEIIGAWAIGPSSDQCFEINELLLA